MRIQHNIMAMNAYRNYTNNVSAMKKNLEKLSSGYKINRAGDDAAGLAISEKMRAQITGLETAQKNAKDGISLVQTAEGALTEVHDMLNRMVELATQSANGTYDNDTDRYQMQKEVDQLLSEIDRIADSSNFNGIKLLDGTLGLNKAAFQMTDTEAIEAKDVTAQVVGTMTAATTTANQVTKLHTDGTKGVAGEFTVYLGQAHVTAPTSATSKANIIIQIGTAAAVTLSAASADKGKEFTASKIAQQWLAASTAAAGAGGNGKYFIVKNDGTQAFAKDTATALGAGAKGLVYEGKANADGSITYKLKGYVNAGSSAIVAAASDGSNLTAANVASNAIIDLNLDVSIAAGSKGTTTVNAANVGTNATNTVRQEDGQMGSTELVLNLDKLEDGMTISINGVKKTVGLTSGTDADIDLSGFLTASGALDVANKKSDIMNAIATEFKDAVTGIDVGVNATGNLTLSENKDASDDVKAAMSKANTFKGLVQVEKPAVSAGKQITFNADKIVDGDVLSITKGKDTVKYVFTKDMTGKTDTTDTKYIDIKGKTSDEVAAAFAEKAGLTADGAAVTVTDGTLLGRGLTLQIGDTSDDYNQLNVAVQNMHAADLGIGGLNISDEVSAQAAIQKIKDAINTVSDVRGTLGATQNRLDHTINNLSVMTENIQDAESTIRDVDVAEEMMAYTKNNILIQSAQAMLAQANQVPQGVLQLLQ